MKRKDCVAMILAGGQGSRLGSLTKAIAKPVVPFGGKYKIIDFALSNCINSGIDTVGVLTQYQPHELSRYIGSGQPWDMDRYNGGIYILPPYMKGKSGEWYKGTANAIYQNIAFIESFGPEDVLVLSGDHIYIMDYRPMIEAHESKGADATIAVITVPWEEASRFGIMAVDEDGRVSSFAEKPKKPASNLASMGVYVFNWGMLKKYLLLDEQTEKSSNDFGKNIIPMMLRDGMKLFAHSFHSYWKDVGTIESLWQANMDLLAKPLPLDMYADNRRIYCRNPVKPPHFVASGAKISNSLVTEGCEIYGEVEKSVVFTGVAVGRGSRITNSVIFPNARIGEGCVIDMAIIGDNASIGDGASIGDDSALIGNGAAAGGATAAGGVGAIGRGAPISGGAGAAGAAAPGTAAAAGTAGAAGSASGGAAGATGAAGAAGAARAAATAGTATGAAAAAVGAAAAVAAGATGAAGLAGVAGATVAAGATGATAVAGATTVPAAGAASAEAEAAAEAAAPQRLIGLDSLSGAEIFDSAFLSEYCTGGISLIAPDVAVGSGIRIGSGSMVDRSVVAPGRAECAAGQGAAALAPAGAAPAAGAQAKPGEAAPAATGAQAGSDEPSAPTGAQAKSGAAAPSTAGAAPPAGAQAKPGGAAPAAAGRRRKGGTP